MTGTNLRRACVVTVAIGMGLVATGVTLVVVPARAPAAFGTLLATNSSAVTTARSASHLTVSVTSPPAPTRTYEDRTPQQLSLPSQGITAAVSPVGVSGDRSLVVPPDPRQVGWWTGGAQPGTATGTILIAGHVDDVRLGRGALYHLESLQVGDPVRLSTPAGEYTYRVVARRSYDKNELPTELFDQSIPARLALVTCGGPFQPGHGYAANVVVYATPR
jgi:hypothetical protein